MSHITFLNNVSSSIDIFYPLKTRGAFSCCFYLPFALQDLAKPLQGAADD